MTLKERRKKEKFTDVMCCQPGWAWEFPVQLSFVAADPNLALFLFFFVCSELFVLIDCILLLRVFLYCLFLMVSAK